LLNHEKLDQFRSHGATNEKSALCVSNKPLVGMSSDIRATK
jgi:hypothetical protein